MSNKFQPWSEIEDEILLQELEENNSINNIANNHKRTYNAITTRIGRIAGQRKQKRQRKPEENKLILHTSQLFIIYIIIYYE